MKTDEFKIFSEGTSERKQVFYKLTNTGLRRLLMLVVCRSCYGGNKWRICRVVAHSTKGMERSGHFAPFLMLWEKSAWPSVYLQECAGVPHQAG